MDSDAFTEYQHHKVNFWFLDCDQNLHTSSKADLLELIYIHFHM